jgi:carbon starvation protein
MIILLAVLALVVVQALAQSPWGVFTIAVTIPIALIMGIALRTGKVSVLAVTIFGLLGLAFGVWGGQFLGHFPAIEAWFHQDQKWLAWAIMIYGLAASILPVWMLLTPRDYLSTFLKLGTVALLAVAVVLINPTLQMPAITKFIDGSGLVFAGPVFPFVCITIACGAVSGFHSLIASGTTPKMIRRESRIRSIGYGAMVTEMMVALMAMIAACVLEPGEYFAINTKGTPAEVVAKVSAVGFPNADSRHEPRRVHNVQSRRWRADICCRHGTHVRSCLCQACRAGAVVSLRHHVRGTVHSDNDRRRNTSRSVSTSGCSGTRVASARQHAFVERKLSRQLFAGRGMGLVFV